MPDRTRLHISPFNSELLSVILPPSILPTASGISYHTLQTFPERNYGFVELAKMDAEKVKKKLNGSILKGSKVRVEEARPEKYAKGLTNDGEVQEGETPMKTRKATKRSRRAEGVIPGFELPADRKVKRGWSEPASKLKDNKDKKRTKEDKKTKSKTQVPSFGSESELLFRTKLPLNTSELAQKNLTGEEKTKKRKRGKLEREVTVHEFSNSTKHATFLRENQPTKGTKIVSEYVESKGWVDEAGNIVEPPSITKREGKKTRATEEAVRKERPAIEQSGLVATNQKAERVAEDVDETTTSGSSSSAEGDSEGSEPEISAQHSDSAEAQGTSKMLLRSRSATKDDDDEYDSEAVTRKHTLPLLKNIQITEAEEAATTTTSQITPSKDVHPLEALFKRPKPLSSSPRKPNLEVKTSFSFFQNEERNIDTNRLMPQTPFTQHDLQRRGLRSAAPTPDTAAPNKSAFGNLWGGMDDIESDENEDAEEEEHGTDDTPLARKVKVAEGEPEEKPAESDFSKWFWEHRGDTNRAWKKRKREATKEKRQKENRRRSQRIA